MSEIELKLSDKDAELGKVGEITDKKGRLDLGAIWEKNKLSVILAGLGVLLLGIGVLSVVVLSSKTGSSEIEILSAEEQAKTGEIMVHVTGAVEQPGLYKLETDARVNDALVAAGGLAGDADREWFGKYVNLAQKLSDGVKMYVPFRNEVDKVGKVEEVEKGIVAGEQSIFFQETQGKININTASLEELDSLPGIGPTYAQRIIDYRKANGPFSSIEEVTKVKGIGQSTFEKIRDKITIF